MRDQRVSFPILALLACFCLGSASLAYAGGKAPAITSLSTTSGPVGASVAIYGSNFGSSQGTSTVTFNGTPATSIQGWSSSSITVVVPVGATTGNVVVKVGANFSNGVAFTVVPPPVISSISPTSGPVGSWVTISGSNFGPFNVESWISFNGAGAYFTSADWSDTSIVAQVPVAYSGNVTVYLGSGVHSNGVPFTVWPYISGISPDAAPAGASVTISGLNFGASQGSSSVTFNGATANVTSWSSNSIVATVPSGATSGNVVVTGNGETSNGMTFGVGTPSTAPYHLHQEAGWSSGTDLLSVAAPDASSMSIQSPNLKGLATGGYATIEAFSTQSAVPGFIPAGTTVNFSLWMNETSAVSGLYPLVNADYLDSLGNYNLLCATNGSIALTTTLTELQLSCTTGKAIALGTSNRLYINVSVTNSGGPPTGNLNANLYLGGILNGDYDSQVVIPQVLYPYVLSLSPTTGSAGTIVTVTGGNFGASQGSSTLTFNGVAATPSTWSNTSIIAPVPANATTGPVLVTVSGQSSSPVTFTVPATISSVSPSSGPVGTAVTITGAGFGATQGTSTVSFNGIPAAAASWSSTTIVAAVPIGAATGPLSVTVSGVVGSGGNFTVTPMISAIAPSVGGAGSSVRIRGYNFGTTQGTVTFNGMQSSLGSWLDGSIVATVPSGASTGPVVVVNAGGFSSNQVNFTVAPNISSISPVSGSSGTIVTISGLNFGAAQGSSLVMFNGAQGSPTSWSNTSITVPAPAGVLTGPVTVVSGGSGSNGVTFAVAPSIQSLSPNSGSAGTVVTITGNGFGTPQGSSWVEFAGTLASPTSWSNTKIVTPVPTGATSGQVIVGVSGQQNSNGLPFTVGSGGINGAVTGSGSGSAIAGASIQVLLAKKVVATSTTAADGSYSIPTLQSGTYDVTASASGYGTTLSSNQSVTANATTTVNFSLSPPGTISGKVTQFDGVTGIAGATVTASTGGDNLGTATTDSSGNYSLGSLSAGTYSATAAESGYTSQTQNSLTVSSGASTPASFTLSAESVITYTYDQGGRLAGVSDSLGNTSTYQYDAVGNLLSISQNSSSKVSIIDFSPTSGPVGTTVTISGTAFSTNPTQDSVSFNGTAATITSASKTQLIVTVPIGATTGTISVSAPGGTATSTQGFTVTSGSSQPTITSFTPGSGVAGTAVTINGTDFDVNPSDNVVTFDLAQATVTSATSATIATLVPPSTSSGHISVRTKNGIATSSQDFYVPFGRYSASNIGFTGRMSMNTTQMVALNTAGTIGLMLFDGVAGQRVTIYANNSSFSSCNLMLIDPYGRQVTSMGCTGSSNFSGGQTLGYTGTYTIGIDPQGTTGSVSVSLNGFSNITGALRFDVSTRITTTYPGQTANYVFGGTAGQVIDLALSGETYGCWSYSITSPDGTALVGLHGECGDTTTNNLTLPSTGTYSILINPGAATGGVIATLTQMITTQSMVFNTPFAVSSTLPGQIFYLTFSGTAGQVIDLAQTGETYGCWNYAVTAPDGTALWGPGGACSNTTTGNLTLPSTGTYSILINPFTATGGVTETLTQMITQSISFNTPLSVSNTLPGQIFYLTFSGTAGQVIDLAQTGETYGCWNYAVTAPDGTALWGPGGACSNTTTGNLTLPSTGTYSILINPFTATGGLTADLSLIQ